MKVTLARLTKYILIFIQVAIWQKNSPPKWGRSQSLSCYFILLVNIRQAQTLYFIPLLMCYSRSNNHAICPGTGDIRHSKIMLAK